MASSTPEQLSAAEIEQSRAADPAQNNIAGLPTGVVLLVALAAVVVAMSGVAYVKALVGPVFFALTLVIAVRPAAHWMIRRGLPAWLSSLLVLIFLYFVLLGMMAILAVSVAQLTTTLPEYSSRFDQLYQQGLDLLARYNVKTSDIEVALSKFDYTQVVGVAQKLLSGLSAGSTQLVTLLIVMAFVGLDTVHVGARAQELSRARPHLGAALANFATRVRSYWVVSTVFGFIVSVIDYGVLLALGVPMAFTWAVFAFITNYIPNVGFVLGLVPPALLGLLAGGPGTMLWVVVSFSVINFVIQSIIQPKFTGDAVGLNTSVTFISLIFWTSVIGPLGAVLAVPLTLFLKSVLIDSDPRLRWLNVFLKSATDKEEDQMPDQGDLQDEERQTSRLGAMDSESGPEAKQVESDQAHREGARARERAAEHD